MGNLRSLATELSRRELADRYKGTVGGFIWAFIHPLFLLAIYTLAFGVLLQPRWGDIDGTLDYAFLLFAGLIVYNAVSDVLVRSATLIVANPNYVKKVVFPLEILGLTLANAALFNALISVLIWVVGSLAVLGSWHASAFYAPLILLCLAPVLIGIALLVSALGVVFRDVSQISTIVAHALLFLTPVFYSVESAPQVVRYWLGFNPMTLLIEQLRVVLYYGDAPDFFSLLVYFIVGSVFALVALTVFRRMQPGFADQV